MQWATANESRRASTVVSHNPNYIVIEDFEENNTQKKNWNISRILC